MLTIGSSNSAKFLFGANSVADFSIEEKQFELQAEDFGLLNPNTRTCPVFRSRADANLTKKIYGSVPILWNEIDKNGNTWGIDFLRMIDMSNDSEHLREFDFRHEIENPVPLYEAKMLHQYDHRWATFALQAKQNLNRDSESGDDFGDSSFVSVEDRQRADPNFAATPKSWISKQLVEDSLADSGYTKNWLYAWRSIALGSVDRTVIGSVFPRYGAGNSLHIILTPATVSASNFCGFIGNISSLVFDYVARQKISGTNFNYFIPKQLPVLPPKSYSEEQLGFIVPRVLELTYTAHDLKPFYNDVVADDPAYDPRAGENRGQPFAFNLQRRAELRAELDACYAKLYGLSRRDLEYILDPAAVMGEDYPSETFRVLKNKELREFGEYRTQRLVLAAWDAQERIQPARRKQLLPAYAQNQMPQSEAEDWLLGVLYDLLVHAGPLTQAQIEPVLSASVAADAPWSAERIAWLSAAQRARLPELLRYVRRAWHLREQGPLSAPTDPAIVASILGDERTRAIAELQWAARAGRDDWIAALEAEQQSDSSALGTKPTEKRA